MARLMVRDSVLFQSTHPRGVRRERAMFCCVMTPFQSTHPRGVRPSRACPDPRPWPVSIHAPAWGATSGGGRMSEEIFKFQSTHPRGVRPGWPGRPCGRRTVSIHAPAWGATGLAARYQGDVPVSIHAPAWGATSRRPGCAGTAIVSIHAPAWGATAYGAVIQPFHKGFNPRTRVGCDPRPMGEIP